MGNLPIPTSNQGERSTTHKRTYSSQLAPMIGFATLSFSYNRDEQFSFPLTVCITEMKTQNLLGVDFCQKQVSGIHFDSPGIAHKEPSKTVCYRSPHRTNRTFSFRKSKQYELRIQCTLKARAQDAGSIILKILTLISLLDQLFTQIAMLLLPDYHLPMCYALNQNQNYLY